MFRKIVYRWKWGAVIAALFLFASQIPIGQASSTPAPILLVTNSAYTTDPFGSFLGEILRAEGLNEYDTIDLSQVTSSVLSQYTVVILAQTPLTSAQASIFTGYENAGGQLVAMRPDAQIAGLFGLGSSAGAPQNNGYLLVNSSAQINNDTPGQAIASSTLQIHGPIDRYNSASSAVTLAQLYSDATTATPYPAVISGTYGLGRGVAFLYDLAMNVVYMRQGNPNNATYVNPTTGVTGDVDGDGVYRTIDLFETQGGGAPWVDLNNVPIPQADEQMRLFSRVVRDLNAVSKPLPKLWYFPGNAKTMLIMTGDAHGNPDSYYQYEINSINAHGGKITFYLSIASAPSPSNVVNWMTYGHTFGIHPYANHPDTYPPYNTTTLQQGYSATVSWFSQQYGVSPYNIPMSRTVRNHQVAWAGWTDSADYAAAYNIGLDVSFYVWGTWLKKPDGTWANGYTTGSGLPMKFARTDGSLVPVYQQLTELVDEQYFSTTDAGYENLTAAQAIQLTEQEFNASLAGYYTAFVSQNHVDYYQNGDPQTWAEGMMDYANSVGIPIWNADSWLNFTQARHDANYSNVSWNAATGTLSFNLSAAQVSGVNLTTMLPMSYQGNALNSVTVDGSPATFTPQTIKGESMAFVVTSSGNHSFSAKYSGSFPTATATITPNGPTSTPTPTTSVATNTPQPPTPTNTGVAPTATNTGVAPTATNTGLPPTATNTGVVPTATNTLQPGTPTNTPLPPTATNTPLPPTPTNTPPPPTATNTPVVPTPTSSPLGSPLVLTGYSGFSQACVVLNNTHVSDPGGGSVALAAAYNDDFNNANLDASKWTSGNWSGGAYTPTIGNSVLTVMTSGGGWVRSVPTYTHGVIEALAQFGNAAYQHIGFGSDGFNGNQYLLFSTYQGNGDLFARVNNNGSEQNADLGPIPSGMHHYRIEWNVLDSATDQVVFYIDGVQQALFTLSNAGASNYYVYISNATTSAPLNVDYIQAIPAYVSSGSYTSCTLDAGSGNTWQSIAWNANAPSGTGLTVQAQTSTDGSTWSAWSTVSNSSGSSLASPARYARFQLLMSTSVSNLTPLVSSVTLTPLVPATPTPTPTNTPLPPTPTDTPLPPTATNTPLPPTATNTPLPPTATNTPLPPTATSTPPPPTPTATNTSLPPTATNTPLPPTATNTPLPPTATSTPPPPTPTATPPSSNPLVISGYNGFGLAGAVLSNTHVSDPNGGSVALAATFADDFPGTTLNSKNWKSGGWSGGSYTPTISNSVLTVLNSGGGWVRSTTTYTHGVIEAYATFGNGAYQHIGFGSNGFNGNRYFIFSTYTGNGHLYARVNNNVAEQNADLGPIPVGMHHYRIEWNALNSTTDQILFYLDGVSQGVFTVTDNGANNFYVYLSNNTTSAPLLVDYAQAIPPYFASGSYTSVVYDAGSGNTWKNIAWSASVPSGSGLTVQAQTSSDGVTWSGWSSVTNSAGSPLTTPARFVQFRLLLTTSDTTLTPLVSSVTLTY